MHPFIERLGLRVPILQAPMAGVSTPALAAAVTQAGGLGALGLGAMTVDQAEAALRAAAALTTGPICVPSASACPTFNAATAAASF